MRLHSEDSPQWQIDQIHLNTTIRRDNWREFITIFPCNEKQTNTKINKIRRFSTKWEITDRENSMARRIERKKKFRKKIVNWRIRLKIHFFLTLKKSLFSHQQKWTNTENLEHWKKYIDFFQKFVLYNEKKKTWIRNHDFFYQKNT